MMIKGIRSANSRGHVGKKNSSSPHTTNYRTRSYLHNNDTITNVQVEDDALTSGQERRSALLRRTALALVSVAGFGRLPATAEEVQVFEENGTEMSQMRTISKGSAIDGQGALNVILSDQLETAEEDELSVTQRQALQINRRTQRQNNAPPDFPLFVREGYDMTVLASGGYQVTDDGLIYKDYVVGSGKEPRDGQQVTFDYTAYNESASVIDSSYRKGQAASTRLGIAGMIPGFEMGIKTMKPGGKRRIVVPPELGPPVGPSTFFSAKQFEVFDVELRSSKTCTRRTIGMFSDVVCTDDEE
jgi:FKBP-type peptidyl-prolyl cis-trans isomerase